MDRWVSDFMMRDIMMDGCRVYVMVYVMVWSLMGIRMMQYGRMSIVMIIMVVVTMRSFPWSWHISVNWLILGSKDVAVVVSSIKSVICMMVWMDHLMVWNVIVVVMHWSVMASLMIIVRIIVACWVKSLV